MTPSQLQVPDTDIRHMSFHFVLVALSILYGVAAVVPGGNIPGSAAAHLTATDLVVTPLMQILIARKPRVSEILFSGRSCLSTNLLAADPDEHQFSSEVAGFCGSENLTPIFSDLREVRSAVLAQGYQPHQYFSGGTTQGKPCNQCQ